MIKTILIAILLTTTLSYTASCRPYIPYLKTYSEKYLGEDFPYWYFIGQDYQESNCRFVISYDGVGSESPAQITWKIWKRYLKSYGIKNLRTIDSFTKAQVLIMKRLIHKANKKGYKQLWIPFQAYNGGWLVLKETKRTPLNKGILMQHDVKSYCRRKTITFKNGSTRKACDINYNYPIEIATWVAKYYSDFIKETSWHMW